MGWQSGGFVTLMAGEGALANGSRKLNVEPLDADRILVRRVFDSCHEYIAEAVTGTALPEEFLGALTANESGGKAGAACFEPAVYKHLKAVASGQAPSFGSIAWKQLSSALQQTRLPEGRLMGDALANDQCLKEITQAVTSAEESGLRDFATSWSFTQIMGYQVIGRKADIKSLLDPHLHYHLAIDILGEFAQRFHLELARDFESLFHCWNTGRPDGRTFDADYVAKGMRRMNLYRSLAQPANGWQPPPTP